MAEVGRYVDGENHLRGIDTDWARIVDQIGPCTHDPKAAREPYEALVRAIAYQQLTAKAGNAILSRLKALMPQDTFLRPEQILSASFDDLRACGFSATKVATVQAIAEGALSGLVPARSDANLMSDEDLIDRMMTIKGVGRWTVEMLLMYTMERLDVLPVDDFGIREDYRALKDLPAQPKPKVLHEAGKAWAPYRTVASWYLWHVPRKRGNVLA